MWLLLLLPPWPLPLPPLLPLLPLLLLLLLLPLLLPQTPFMLRLHRRAGGNRLEWPRALQLPVQYNNS